MSLDGFSLFPLARELNNILAGGRIDKITQPNKQSIVLNIRQPGKNFLLHISAQPQNPMVCLLEKPLENPAEPPVFCMVLRKQLETGRIAAIKQYSLDRIITLEIDFLAAGGKIITKKLIVELMGKYSNIILEENGIIRDALRKIGTNSSRVRTILPGDPYVFPPAQTKLSLLDKEPAEITAAIKSRGEEKISKAVVNTCLGFGPVSGKEAVFLANIAPTKTAAELNPEEFAALTKALAKLKEQVLAPIVKPCLIHDKNGKLLAMAAFPLHFLPEEKLLSFETCSQMLSAAAKLSGSYLPPEKEQLQKFVQTELNRAENKLSKLQEELATAQNAEEFKQKADNLMTYQYQLQDHADAAAEVTDIYSETGETITIELDQRLTIIENMQAYYKRYDKLKRAQALLQNQLTECRTNIAYLESIAASLLSSSTLTEIHEIKNELFQAGHLKEKPQKKIHEKPSEPIKIICPEGTEILIGKNNYQNDKLTFKTAQNTDIWLHTKDIPGSHVILRCGQEEPADDALLLAAELAAHFSKASGSAKVPVDYTRCRYVKKPSGAKPGFVIFTHQKTLYVTPDENRLKPLLLNSNHKI